MATPAAVVEAAVAFLNEQAERNAAPVAERDVARSL